MKTQEVGGDRVGGAGGKDRGGVSGSGPRRVVGSAVDPHCHTLLIFGVVDQKG